MCSPRARALSNLVRVFERVEWRDTKRKVIRPLTSPKRGHLTLSRPQRQQAGSLVYQPKFPVLSGPDQKQAASIPPDQPIRCSRETSCPFCFVHLFDQLVKWHEEIMSQRRHQDPDSKNTGGPSSVMTGPQCCNEQPTSYGLSPLIKKGGSLLLAQCA